MFRRSLVLQVSRMRLMSTIRRPVIQGYKYNQRLSTSTISWTKCYSSSTFGNEVPSEVIKISTQTFHNESNKFLDNLFDQLEDLSEFHPDEIPDVELNQGVMTIEIATLGSYVLNKQPPNKQIWLASPISGPDRFDFYKDEWISLRNGNKLSDVLTEELKKVLPDETLNL